MFARNLPLPQSYLVQCVKIWMKSFLLYFAATQVWWRRENHRFDSFRFIISVYHDRSLPWSALSCVVASLDLRHLCLWWMLLFYFIIFWHFGKQGKQKMTGRSMGDEHWASNVMSMWIDVLIFKCISATTHAIIRNMIEFKRANIQYRLCVYSLFRDASSKLWAASLT